jgi:chromosome segregation ATPase
MTEQPKIQATMNPKLTVRNVNKKLKRRDEKIVSYKSEVAGLSKENKMLQDRLASAQCVRERTRVAAYWLNQRMGAANSDKAIYESRLQELGDQYFTHVSTLEATVKDFSITLDTAKAERDELAERLTKLESQKVKTKQHSQLYLDGVRQCCIELMTPVSKSAIEGNERVSMPTIS